ncbi:MAG: 5-dehydro-4-deoxy-D-glucuronate isomerase [Ekhidna sp.]|nr:5-dehydro-4-deoxy-D-glucuronate isomerase [Ekhidna sp.]
MTDIRYANGKEYVKSLDTEQLREHFLIQQLFETDAVRYTLTMHDRMLVMGISPKSKDLKLPALEEITKADYLLERRELGIINIGGAGKVVVDGSEYLLENRECLYIGKGSKEIIFSTNDSAIPAEFYINCLPAHATYPTKKATLVDANQVSLGSKENCNERVIYQYIHEEGIESCQLVMGFTLLKPGSIWNTFPPHTHDRRMEVYFYFDLPADQLVMHFMGDPEETRHIVMRNKEAVISPEWSIHSGVGTSAYTFIWGMGGENKAFTDMDAADLSTFK